MMRSLWIASGGMASQQLNVDVISNNLANVNTTGYKKERIEFKDLLYQTISRASIVDGQGQPVNLQVGMGVAPHTTVKNFGMGNLEKTENPLDFAIEGDAFFKVLDPNNEILYTRDGSFKISVTGDGINKKITTSDGYTILDENDQEILIDFDLASLVVGVDGALSYIDEEGVTNPLGQSVSMVKFPNRAGLESIGKNFYRANSASGEPVLDSEEGRRSNLRQGFLESSNVQVVEEMIKLIVAQRSYEINSKAIQTSDEMLSLANNLRR